MNALNNRQRGRDVANIILVLVWAKIIGIVFIWQTCHSIIAWGIMSAMSATPPSLP